MQIAGIQKTTLVDFPGKVAATIFTRGCTFRCGFCHNPELVIPERFIPLMGEEEIYDFFDKRKGKLQGVCITGGEPTMNKDLPEFIARLKKLGYAVKLDTNGTNPLMLEDLIKSGNLDYIAMDIKTTLDKYPMVANPNFHAYRQAGEIRNSKRIQNNDLKKTKIYKKLASSDLTPVSSFEFRVSDLRSRITRSVQMILQSPVDYEFRTTVCHPIHSVEEFEEIGKLIKGAKRYFIQSFVQSKHNNETVKYAPFADEEIAKIVNLAGGFVKVIKIRQ